MVTFDSPIERCTVCRQIVLLDQTQNECATEHGCGSRECALGKYFEGIRISTEKSGNPGVKLKRRSV
jgi:hypothetical protein